MATANVSEDNKQNIFTTAEQLYCSSDITTGIHGEFTFISVLNAFLSVTAFLGNALILVALRKESSLHPPSKLLLRNLATTDICVGLISEPLAVTLEHLSLCTRGSLYNKQYFVWGVSVDTDCNKRGETSRPVVGAKIQTSCNFKASLFDHYHLLGGDFYRFSIQALLEFHDNFMV